MIEIILGVIVVYLLFKWREYRKISRSMDGRVRPRY